MSRDYLLQHPSRSFTMRNLGSHLVPWLEANPNRIQSNQQLILDMARLEWAQIEAFDGAQRAVVTPEVWARAGEDAGLTLQPYIRLVDARHAVDDLLLEIKKLEDSNAKVASWRRKRLALIEPEECCIVVHRAEYSVCYRRVEREAFQLLQALQAGDSLGEALEKAFAGSAVPQERWPALVQEWFSLWMNLGWFSA
jgi:hypothetical protein